MNQELAQYLTAISILVALIAVIVAREQSKTNRLKLKFDLYEKRLTYFKALTELLVAAGTGNVASEELIKFGHKIHDSNFLFGKDISNYLKENFDNAADLNSIHEQFKEASLLNEEEKIRLVKKRTELEKWFYRQFEISKRKFSKYLSFENLK